MDKSLKIVSQLLVTTLIASVTGCSETTPAPIREATLSSMSTTLNDETSDSHSDTSNTLSQNSAGWVPTPPAMITMQGPLADDVTDNTSTSNPTTYSSSSRLTMQEQPAQTQTTNHSSRSTRRDYNSIVKGSFVGDRYIVQAGDTLFYIAWISNNDYRDLAQKNKISEPYNLTVGQVLIVGNVPQTASHKSSLKVNTGITPTPSTTTPKPTNSSVNKPAAEAKSKADQSAANKPTSHTTSSSVIISEQPVKERAQSQVNMSKINWRWPTAGTIIEKFSTSEAGNKGIDIAGSKGQKIVAAADGRVVYAGNGLRGYGYLIIIKHNDDYLSAYAHNDSILVSAQQEVKGGQPIATMGSTDATSVRLHFEVRYKGKSVNPLQYLPQR